MYLFYFFTSSVYPIPRSFFNFGTGSPAFQADFKLAVFDAEDDLELLNHLASISHTPP